MVTWALANTLLTVLALAFALLNTGSPHRLRFHVCMLALLCWLVPWSQVGGWMPDLLSLDLWRVEQRLITGSASATQMPLLLVDTSAVPLADPLTVLHVPLLVLAALLAIGCVLYGWSVLQHALLLRSLRHGATDGSHLWQQSGLAATVPVLLQDRINGAFSSGIITPRIWINRELATSAELPTLLRHELTHIHQHDNAWLLVITLVEKLFWWNPLVAYLGRQTRQLQELSCDERCCAANAAYPAQLAQLMLGNLGISRSTAQEPLLLSANIFNKPAINIQRLRVLQRSHQMKPRHIASAIATAVLAVTAVGLVTAQPESDVVFATGGGTFNAAVPGQPGEAPQMVMGFRAADGTSDQFMKVQRINGEESVSFNFTDAALPFALGPLAQMLAGPPAQQLALAMQAGEPVAAGQQRVVIATRAAPGAGGPGMAMPMSDKLVLETEDAKTRKVTVQGDSLTLDAAIEAIAKASNCNIFKDGDTIVVDWCGAQQ